MIGNRNWVSAAIGVILILAGLVFLVGQLFSLHIGAYVGPFMIMAFGGLFFAGMAARGPAGGSLAIPGSVLVTIGLISLVETIFGHGIFWAYSWGLLISAVGVGLIIRGRWSSIESDRSHGWRLVRLGLLLFLIFGAFFELLLGYSHTSLAARIFWPIILIGVGLYIFISRFITGSRPTSGGPTSFQG